MSRPPQLGAVSLTTSVNGGPGWHQHRRIGGRCPQRPGSGYRRLPTARRHAERHCVAWHHRAARPCFRTVVVDRALLRAQVATVHVRLDVEAHPVSATSTAGRRAVFPSRSLCSWPLGGDERVPCAKHRRFGRLARASRTRENQHSNHTQQTLIHDVPHESVRWTHT